MAKRQSRSGKPAPGGRVTPKGVRPAGSTGKAHTDGNMPQPGTARPERPASVLARSIVRQAGPTRAGHHHGQR